MLIVQYIQSETLTVHINRSEIKCYIEVAFSSAYFVHNSYEPNGIVITEFSIQKHFLKNSEDSLHYVKIVSFFLYIIIRIK